MSGALPLAGAGHVHRLLHDADRREHRRRRLAGPSADGRRSTTRTESARFAWLFPTVALNALPNHTFLMLTRSTARGTRARSRTSSTRRRRRPLDATASEAVDDLLAFWDEVNREDIGIVERVQRGLANPAYTGGRMCYRFEEARAPVPEHGDRPDGRASAGAPRATPSRAFSPMFLPERARSTCKPASERSSHAPSTYVDRARRSIAYLCRLDRARVSRGRLDVTSTRRCSRPRGRSSRDPVLRVRPERGAGRVTQRDRVSPALHQHLVDDPAVSGNRSAGPRASCPDALVAPARTERRARPAPP